KGIRGKRRGEHNPTLERPERKPEHRDGSNPRERPYLAVIEGKEKACRAREHAQNNDHNRFTSTPQPKLAPPISLRTVLGERGKSRMGTSKIGEFVSVSREGAIATVTVDRGDGRNALSRQLILELTETARSFTEDLTTHAVILAAKG